LAFLDVPALGQPETFIQVKEDLFDEGGNIANENSKKFLQGWMNHYVKWVKKLAAGIEAEVEEELENGVA